ncbi:MAG: hypothetical protein K0R98_1334 [Rickettsiaceae bacterium]|jgi:hypothetical protein|nr:hypothetical protein [Rickettsiaceae bacterium]
MAIKHETPKEGRFTRSKNLKTDSILEVRELMHKLERIAHELHNMSEEEREKLWPQTATIKAPKSTKKTEKEFLVSLLAQAHNSITTAEFFKKHDIDINNKHTRELVKKQSEALAIVH